MTDPLATVAISFDAPSITTPLAVVSFEFEERFDQPYTLRVRLGTTEASFEPGTLLGRSVTVLVERGELSRDIHGIVVRVNEGARPTADSHSVHVTVRPAWCALEQRKSARIFQDSSVPQIVQQVAEDLLTGYDRHIDTSDLQGDYPALEYAVQYGETDLAFVERLLAEHGIGYSFDHSGDTEVVKLFDSVRTFGSLESVGNADGALPVRTDEDAGVAASEEARMFRLTSQLRPTAAAVQVFDWLNPGSVPRLETTTTSEHDDIDRPQDGASGTPARVMTEHDEPVVTLGYRDAAVDLEHGRLLTEARRELQRRDETTGRGRSTAIAMSPGVRVQLTGNPSEALDATYTIVSVVHRWGKTKGATSTEYENTFETLPAGVLWRPSRVRNKPRVHGIQTATVVGPAGSEIHTDRYGRIQVQFHWDAQAASGAGSSCYLRVMQSLAGNGWGAMFLPRVGMEVVVSFVDGDPDRPVVTGCLYNGTHDVPYALDENKTVSTIKTQSTGQTGGYNELRFEDANGSEEIYIHAQFDFNEDVLHDHATNVTNDQSNTVGGNHTESVTLDQMLTVNGNRTVAVDGNFEETIGGNETRTVQGSVQESVEGSEARTVRGTFEERIGGASSRHVTGDDRHDVTGTHNLQAAAGISTTTPATHSLTGTGGVTITSGAGVDIVAPNGLTMTGSGITMVDNDYFAICSTSGSLTGQSTSLAGYALGGTILKTDFGVVSTAVNGVNLAANGVDLAAKGVGDEKVGCDLKTAGTKIKTTATNLYVSAIMMML